MIVLILNTKVVGLKKIARHLQSFLPYNDLDLNQQPIKIESLEIEIYI